MLRKILLCSLVAALGILFVVLKPAYQAAFNKFYHIPAAVPKLPRATYYMAAAGDSAAIRAVAVAENASSAKIEAAT